MQLNQLFQRADKDEDEYLSLREYINFGIDAWQQSNPDAYHDNTLTDL